MEETVARVGRKHGAGWNSGVTPVGTQPGTGWKTRGTGWKKFFAKYNCCNNMAII
jgi:hypothetical protein